MGILRPAPDAKKSGLGLGLEGGVPAWSRDPDSSLGVVTFGSRLDFRVEKNGLDSTRSVYTQLYLVKT